ncbi:MAG: cation:proton antiporter [candidate division Zixibacteria bacterium]
MESSVYLRDLLIILSAALVVVAVLQKLRIPSIAGFILAGILVGPHGLSLVKDPREIQHLAEIGVALLLFGIGLELSLAKMKRLWKLAVLGGVLQVCSTIMIAYLVATFLGYEPAFSIFIGFLVSLSSTAVVLKGLEGRGEIDAPHGRLTLGILLFQDFMVIPMILVVPILGAGEVPAGKLFSLMGRAIAIILLVIGAAYLAVPRILRAVADLRQRHLFILAVLIISMGTAWAISTAGVSLAIGAFLAGLVVAGSEYRHQALNDMIPFKEVFASIFFISIGMLLDVSIVVDNLALLFILLAAIMMGKFVIVFVTGLIMRLPGRVSILAAVSLAQMGEFAFVLSVTARQFDLIPEIEESYIMAAAVCSMLLTPFAIAIGPRLAAGVGRIRVLTRMMDVSSVEDADSLETELSGHIIIGGFGFAGLTLATALKECGIRYLIVDINPENVQKAAALGHPAFFGDVSSSEVLRKLEITSAAELILVINDPTALERAIIAAREISSDVHIVVRTGYLLDIEPLTKAGAQAVVPSERESAARVTSLVLSRHCVSEEIIAEKTSFIRRMTE